MGNRGRYAASLTAAVALALLCGSSGCAGMRGMLTRKDDPFGKNAPCRLGKNPTVEQVVAHVNTNVDKLQGWRATSVKIRATNAPPLSGNLVVERDKRLRLEVTSIAGKEVDFGSNDDVFWLWVRRNEQPGVYFAAHQDLDIARQKLPLPFEPEWLMEALGVVPLDAQNVSMQGEPGIGTIKLVSDHKLPNGQSVRKVVTVHACHGTVLEHAVYDSHGQPLARAVMGDHRIDPTTQAVMPRYVKLDWPSAGMSLAMDLGRVEVNPGELPAAVWELPQMPGTPMVNMGRSADAVARAAHAGTSVALESAKPRSRGGLVSPNSIEPTHRTASTAEDEFLPPQQGAVTETPASSIEFEFLPPEGVEQNEPVWDEAPGRASLNELPDDSAAIEPH